LRDQDLLRGLPEDELAALQALVERRELAVDDVVVREGEPASEVFFLLAGTVSVRLVVDGRGRTSRLATFGPGVAFGEAALLGESVRTADVCVETPATVAVLTVAALQSLAVDHPALVDRIRTNLTRVVARRLQAANRQIRALQR
jgi:CRP-like cAMP-binding protein